MRRLFWTTVLCLSGPAWAAAAVEVTTDPSPVTLGADAEVVAIAIKGLPGQGPVRAAVNVGAIDSIDTSGAGQVMLRYRLPKKRFPQVLCLALWRTASPGSVHVERIPMLGRTVVTVRTRKRSQITIAVGRRLFGPHDTGRRGQRRVRLLIPPGINQALVNVTDEMGLKTNKTIRIRTPKYNQLTLAISRRRVTTSRPKLRITVAAASTEHEGINLEVEGRPHALKRSRPGVWSGTWSAGEIPPGTISIKAWLPGEPKSVQQAQVEVSGPAAAAEPVKPRVVKVRRHPTPERASTSGGRRLHGIVAASVGMIHNTGAFVSPRFSGEVGLEYRLPRFGWIGARLLVGVSWSSQQIAAPSGLTDVESSVLLVPLGGGITYRYPLPLLTPYVTVDLLALIAHSSSSAAFMEDQAQTAVAVGGLAMAGAERRLGPGRVFLQAGFQWGQVESAELTLMAGGVVVEGGYRLAL